MRSLIAAWLLDLREGTAGLVLDLPLQLGVDVHSRGAGSFHEEEYLPNAAVSLDAAWWFARFLGVDVRLTAGGIVGYPLLRASAGLVFRA